MTTTLAKYHIRSPRYVLQPDEDQIVRLAGPKQIPWEEGTEIKNISLTGLAFTVPADLCPSIGEFVKIQYTLPGSQMMASHALVTRLENISISKILVGVKFYRVELAQRVMLAQSLSVKMKEQKLREQRELKKNLGPLGSMLPWMLLGMWMAVFYLTSSLSWIRYFISGF
jgi:hypothetical protein